MSYIQINDVNTLNVYICKVLHAIILENIKSERDKELTLNAQTVYYQICIFALY